MSDNGKSPHDLTAKEARALVALLQEPTIAKAAKQAGMSTRTLYRVMQRPAFRAALRDGISQSLDRLYIRLAAGSDEALTALHDLITGEDTSEAVRRLASSDWISHFTRLLEDRDIRETRAELEAAVHHRSDPI